MWIRITTIFIRSDIVWAGSPDFLFKDKLLASSVCSYLLRWPENTKRLNMMIVFDKGRPEKRRQIRVKGYGRAGEINLSFGCDRTLTVQRNWRECRPISVSPEEVCLILEFYSSVCVFSCLSNACKVPKRFLLACMCLQGSGNKSKLIKRKSGQNQRSPGQIWRMGVMFEKGIIVSVKILTSVRSGSFHEQQFL